MPASTVPPKSWPSATAMRSATSENDAEDPNLIGGQPEYFEALAARAETIAAAVTQHAPLIDAGGGGGSTALRTGTIGARGAASAFPLQTYYATDLAGGQYSFSTGSAWISLADGVTATAELQTPAVSGNNLNIDASAGQLVLTVIDQVTAVQPPTNGVTGQELVIILTQNATGYGVLFSNAANTGFINPPPVSAVPNATTVARFHFISGFGWINTAPTSNVSVNVTDDVNAWLLASGTWTYSTNDTNTYTVTVNANVGGTINVGDKIRATATATGGTLQYFIVTDVAAGGTSTLKWYGGQGKGVAGAGLANVYYSHGRSPVGFPLNPDGWTETYSSANDLIANGVTANWWWTPHSGSDYPGLGIPLGFWFVSWFASLYASDNSTGPDIYCALSTGYLPTGSGAAPPIDPQFLVRRFSSNTAVGFKSEIFPTGRAHTLTLATKTQYYLDVATKSASAGFLSLGGASGSQTVISATCGWLS